MQHNIAVLLVILSRLLMVKGQEIKNKVACRMSPEEQEIKCGYNEIIDIQSVTIAYTTNWDPCTVDHLIPVTEGLSEECRRSGKDGLGRTHGSEVYKRCHGEQSCTVDRTVFSREYLSHPCDSNGDYSANVLRFNYTCFPVDRLSPSVALLPLGGTVRGTSVHFFSPYYPCNSPKAEYRVTCKVTPQKTDPSAPIRFRAVPKLVRFPKGQHRCGDYLSVQKDASSNLKKFYCNNVEVDKEIWNDPPFVVDADDYLEINYRIYAHGVGGKFWFRITATENQIPVELSVTCTGQEDIPQPPSSCSPFNSIPTTTSTTTTTTTSTRTVISQTEDKLPENSSPNGSGALVGGLVGACVVIVIIAIVAVVLGCKLRQWKKAHASETPAQPVTSEVTQQNYETIPDDLESQNGGYPTMYSTPIGIPEVGAYEEVAANPTNVNPVNVTDTMETGSGNVQGYVNVPRPVGAMNETNAVDYEDVKENAPYEALKRVEYENTKNMDENKVYTGLDNNKRHSKV